MSDIVRYEDKSLLPPASEWATMVEMARVLQKSGFLPEAVNTPEKAVTIMLKGRELGIPPMQAFASINVIKGKPSLSAELMLAMVRERGHSIKILESTDKKCVMVGKRKDTGDEYTSTFTYDMASKAQLTGQGSMYTKYPEPMLRSRCGTNLCRVLFSDVTMGMPATEEVQEYDEPKQQEPPTIIQSEIVDKNTGEIVGIKTRQLAQDNRPEVVSIVETAPVPVVKRRKISDEELSTRIHIDGELFDAGIIQHTIDERNNFLPITLDQFNIALKKISGQPDATTAARKYGLAGTWQDEVKARYNGEGLKMAQQFSAVLHIMWELEQRYQEQQGLVNEAGSDRQAQGEGEDELEAELAAARNGFGF